MRRQVRLEEPVRQLIYATTMTDCGDVTCGLHCRLSNVLLRRQFSVQMQLTKRMSIAEYWQSTGRP